MWAFNGSNAKSLLKLTASSETAQVGKPYSVKVTDGATGDPIEGATVGDVSTDNAGVAEIIFKCSGMKKLKAEAPDTLRSNAIKVTVRS